MESSVEPQVGHWLSAKTSRFCPDIYSLLVSINWCIFQETRHDNLMLVDVVKGADRLLWMEAVQRCRWRCWSNPRVFKRIHHPLTPNLGNFYNPSLYTVCRSVLGTQGSVWWREIVGDWWENCEIWKQVSRDFPRLGLIRDVIDRRLFLACKQMHVVLGVFSFSFSDG